MFGQHLGGSSTNRTYEIRAQSRRIGVFSVGAKEVVGRNWRERRERRERRKAKKDDDPDLRLRNGRVGRQSYVWSQKKKSVPGYLKEVGEVEPIWGPDGRCEDYLIADNWREFPKADDWPCGFFTLRSPLFLSLIHI